MFKKLICITALSLTLTSSPEAYSSEECAIESLAFKPDSVFTGKLASKCNLSKFNNTDNLYLVKKNPLFDKYSLAMSIIEAILGNLYFNFRDTILEKCSSDEFIEYIRRRNENAVRNKITGCVLEQSLLNKWVLLGTSLLAIFSEIGGWYCTGVFLMPSTLLGNLRFINDICYALMHE